MVTTGYKLKKTSDLEASSTCRFQLQIRSPSREQVTQFGVVPRRIDENRNIIIHIMNHSFFRLEFQFVMNLDAKESILHLYTRWIANWASWLPSVYLRAYWIKKKSFYLLWQSQYFWSLSTNDIKDHVKRPTIPLLRIVHTFNNVRIISLLLASIIRIDFIYRLIFSSPLNPKGSIIFCVYRKGITSGIER